MAILDSKTGEVTYIGQVIATGVQIDWNNSMQITSYGAQVWVNGSFKMIYTHNDYDNLVHYVAMVDATTEVLAEIETYKTNLAAKDVAERLEEEAKRVAKGKYVCVNRGRKVPVGTIGQIFWIGNNGYGDSVGLITADGTKYFTALGNVDVHSVDESTAATIAKNQEASLAAWKAQHPRKVDYVTATQYRRYGRKARY